MEIINLILLLPTVLIVLASSIYLSIKLKWLQILRIPYAFSLLITKKGKNKFSSFAALFTVLGGNLGVGNVSGTAIALKSGGPGFILWMIIIIIITSIIKYVTCYLSIKNRKKIGTRFIGGPITYMAEAFNSKKATYLFLCIVLISSLTVGNLVQVNSLLIPLNMIDVPMIIGGVIMAVFFFIVAILSLRKIKVFMSTMIPAMTIAYLTLCVIALIKFNKNIFPSLELILNNFCTVKSFTSGMSLGLILETLNIIQIGALRGIFATDIGLGLEGIVHSSISTKKDTSKFAIEQGLITLLSPFIVAVIAFITTMVLLVTGAYMTELESTNMCIFAFQKAIQLPFTNYLIIVIMFCFAFTTIFTWFFCTKQTIRYVSSNKMYIIVWTIVFTIFIPIGSIGAIRLLWNIADISIALLLCINILAILKIVFNNQEIFTISTRCLKLKHER
ncbi:MAG: alanine:cation symporter family protein [Wolbachia endosymbiont of Fragariocoptes setiger]|nr:alanine:cation symporter family protein [Wolbachia endosymbiont of Fragariocoptes setiger]